MVRVAVALHPGQKTDIASGTLRKMLSRKKCQGSKTLVTTDDTTLREVDQELAEERQRELASRFVPLFVGASVLIIALVAGYQIYKGQKERKAEMAAVAYQSALTSLEENPALGGGALRDIQQEGPAGYAALAGLNEAARLAEAGDIIAAHKAYRDIIDREDISPALRDLARVRAAYLSLDLGGRDAVLADLGPLVDADTALGLYAKEVVAIAALDTQDYEQALVLFEELASDIATPGPLVERSREFAALARAGKGGANIEGQATVDTLLDKLGVGFATDEESASEIPAPALNEPRDEAAVDIVNKPAAADAATEPEIAPETPEVQTVGDGDPSDPPLPQ